MKLKRYFPALLLVLAVLVTSAPALATGAPVVDAVHIATTTWAEVARYAQAAWDIYQRAEQIYNQYLQIQYQIQALRKLEFHSWRDVGPLFYQLDALLREAETITAAARDLEEIFYATFPGSRRYLSFQDEHYTQIQRALNTFRVSLLALQQIHHDTRGSQATLNTLQSQIERAEGHQESLEALGEITAWQAAQLSTISQTLETIATAQIVASSHAINQQAQSRRTQSDALTTTLYRADTAVGSAHSSYSPFPAWMSR